MPALLPTMPSAELDQAYERWFDGDGRAWTPAIDVECDDKA